MSDPIKPVGKLTPLIPSEDIKPVGQLQPLDKAYFQATGQLTTPQKPTPKEDPKITKVWGNSDLVHPSSQSAMIAKSIPSPSELWSDLNAGAASLLSGFAGAPGFVYDVAAAPINYIMSGKFKDDLLAVPQMGDNKALQDPNYVPLSSERFKNEIKASVAPGGVASTIVDAPSKLRSKLNEVVEKNNKEVEAELGPSIEENFRNGDYEKAFKHTVRTVFQSIPTTASMVLGNAAGLTPNQLTLLGGAVFGADKKAELDQKFPDMPEGQKILSSAISGLAENYIESNFGLVKIGAELKKVFLNGGVEAGKKVAEKAWKDVYLPIISKYTGVTAEEMGSEVFTQYLDNVRANTIDGEDRPLTQGLFDAAITAGFMSGPTVSVAGASELSRKKQEFTNQKKTIQKDKEQSDHALEVVKGGDESIATFKEQVNEELKKGNLTPEQADQAYIRVDSYKEYTDLINKSNIDLGDKQQELFDKAFQKQLLEREIETQLAEAGSDPNKLHPLLEGQYQVKKKLAADIQKDINEIMLNAEVKKQPTVGQKTITDIQKKDDKIAEKPKPGEKTKKSSELVKAFKEKYKDKLATEDKRTFEEIPAHEYNAYPNDRRKHAKTAEWLESQPEGKTYGEISEKPFTREGEDNSTLEIKLPDGRRMKFASSMMRLYPDTEQGGKFRGHTREERFDEFEREHPSGLPIGIKAVETTDEDGETHKHIKAFRKDDGRFIAWMKMTHRGSYTPDAVEKDLLDHEETIREGGDGRAAEVGPDKPKTPPTGRQLEVHEEVPMGNVHAAQVQNLPDKETGSELLRQQLQSYNQLSNKAKKTEHGRRILSSIQEKAKAIGHELKAQQEGKFSLINEKGKRVSAPARIRTQDQIKDEKARKSLEKRALNAEPANVQHAIALDIANGVRFDKEDLVRNTKVPASEIPFNMVTTDGSGQKLEFYATTLAENRGVLDDTGDQDAAMRTAIETIESYLDSNGKSRAREYVIELQERLENNGLTLKEIADLEEHHKLEPEVVPKFQKAIDNMDNDHVENAKEILQKGKENGESNEKAANDIAAEFAEPEGTPDADDRSGKQDIIIRDEDAPFQKQSVGARKNVDKVVSFLQKKLPKFKFVYDENLEGAGRLRGNTIYINPYFAGEDTPIHEVGHILIEAMGYNNTVIQSAIRQLKGTDLYKEVKKNYPNLSEKGLEIEVLAEAIGREGEGIFKDETNKSKFKKLLDMIFDWIKRNLGVEKNVAKNLARRILSGDISNLVNESDIEHNQIIGEMGAQFQKDIKANLEMAKKMQAEGVDPKTIYMGTGWEPGFDGKWRYDLIENHDDFNFSDRQIEGLAHLINTGETSTLEIGKAFPNSKIFEAYPELAKIKLEIGVPKNEIQENSNGYYDKANNTIYINPTRFTVGSGKDLSAPASWNSDKLRRTVTHEIQHAIQGSEGFDGGANRHTAPVKELARRLDKEIADEIDELNKLLPDVTEDWTAEQEILNDQIQNLREKRKKLRSDDLSMEAYRRVAGEVEARNAEDRLKLTNSERKWTPISASEKVSREDQLKSEGGISSSLDYYREKHLGKDTQEEQEHLDAIKELLKDPELSKEEKEELIEVRDAILDEIAEDKKAYKEFKEEKKKLDKIAEAEDLEKYSFDELVESARLADKYESKEAKLRIGSYLNNEGVKRLSKINPEIVDKANTKDFTWLQKWNKVLSNVSEYFPALQELHKVFEDRYLAKVQEMNKIKANNEKLAKAVIKEKNGKLGSASDWFTSNSAKYFEYLEQDGKLKTSSTGMTKAQKDYWEFMRDLVSERKELQDEDGNVLDNTLIKIDKGFWETFGSGEYKQAMKQLLPKTETNSFNWNGELTSRFDRAYKGEAYSKDFYKAANLFIEDLTHVKYMKDLVPVVDGVELFYRNVKQDGGPELKNLIEFIKEWKKSKIYQETGSTDPKIDIPLRVLRGLTSVSTMAWNIPANVMNVFIGNVNAIVKDGFVQSFITGNGRLATKKGQAILKMYDVIKTDYDSNPKLHAGKAIEWLAFAGLRFGEIQIQGSQFLGKLSEADLDNFKMTEDGVELKETLKDENGKEITKQEFDRKMGKYRREVSDVQGKYADQDKSNSTNYEFGKALMQFKQWLPAFWKDKFGAEFINSDNEVKRGTFNYTKKALEELKKDWSDYGVFKGTWKNDQTMSNIKYLSVMAALTALSWADDDDEDKRKKALSLNNALHQMMFVFDLQQSKYMVTSPLAAQGPLTKLLDAMIALKDGNDKKFTKNAVKLLPHNKLLTLPEQAEQIEQMVK